MPAKLISIYCVNDCCDWHKQTFSSNQVQLCCYTSTAPEPAVVQCVLLLWTCWCCCKGWWWRSVVWWGAGVEQLAALLSIANTEQVIWLVTVLTEAVVTIYSLQDQACKTGQFCVKTCVTGAFSTPGVVSWTWHKYSSIL